MSILIIWEHTFDIYWFYWRFHFNIAKHRNSVTYSLISIKAEVDLQLKLKTMM